MYLGGNRHWVPLTSHTEKLQDIRFTTAQLLKLILKPPPTVLFNNGYIFKNIINLT